MKSLTEFGGVQIRMAAAALAEARRSLPAEAEPTQPEPAPSQAEPTDAGAAEVGDAATQQPAGDVEAAPTESPAEAVDSTPDAAGARAGAPKEDRGAESESVKAALDEAVAKATGLSGDRLSMLRAAVQVVGKRTADVRMVRVFGPEEQVPGAKTVGEHQYLVDYLPASMKQVAAPSKEERGRRGGGGRGGGGGGRGGGTGRGAATGGTGGFSMDSLRDDRKNERGGGRGRPGGGRKPGAPGGGPKK
jgi:translation initiation factor IF-2